ncbi:MAG: hypothetical protein H8D23_22120 [Candidatus Brocadiales bacterium]|nr:hypothetical protein [Candidatus Brocadiales bacterium]
MIFPDSDKCTVDWNYNKLDGQVTVTYSNGTIYVGEWKDGKKNMVMDL